MTKSSRDIGKTSSILNRLSETKISESELSNIKLKEPSAPMENTSSVTNTPATEPTTSHPISNSPEIKNEIDEILTYNPINNYFDTEGNPPILQVKDYSVMLNNTRSFICFIYNGEEKKPENDLNTNEAKVLMVFGLKFHISLPEPDNEKQELSKGWNIVCSILNKYHVDFKIIRRGICMYDEPTQRGKIVTSYTTLLDKDSKIWQNIFQEITQKLKNANVPPGYRPPGTLTPERELNGSNYITYRFDYNEDNLKFLIKNPPKLKSKMLAEIQKLKTELNIDQLKDKDNQIELSKDPISKLNIKVAGQIAIPEWQEAREDASIGLRR